MNKNDYQQLKEIQGLIRQKEQTNKAILEERGRIRNVEIQEEKRKQELETKRTQMKRTGQQLQDTEAALQKVQKNLLKNKERLPLLTSDNELKASLKEKEHQERESAKLQPQIMAYLETIEESQQKQVIDEQFLLGIDKTKQDITREVEEKVSGLKVTIDGFDSRIESLLSTLPVPLKTRFSLLIQQSPLQVPLATVVNGACSYCKMVIGRNDLSILEKGHEMSTCNHCGKILLPSTL